jgi:hypothetical protein
MKRTAMYDGMMTNGNIIANSCATFLKGAVNAGSILYIDLVSQAYEIDITPYHRIEPDTAIVAHNGVADYSRVWGDKTIVSELRMYIIYGKNYWHSVKG